MRAFAILGPNASERDVAPFRRSGALISIEPTPGGGADAVLVFGGDGTVHRHLSKLVETQAPLLVVPVGSGNDFARALGIRSARHALAIWERFVRGEGSARSIDLGVITPVSAEAAAPEGRSDSRAKAPPATGNWKLGRGNFFCCIGGAGLDAATNRRANALPRWLRARGGYILSAVQEIARFRPQRISIAVPDASGDFVSRFSEPATLVAFGNAPTYGDGMRMAPRARLNDGKLDLCFVRATSRLRLLTFFPTVFLGAHLRMPEVEYFQAERLRIASEAPLDVYADGEYLCRTPIEVSVVPAALRVITA